MSTRLMALLWALVVLELVSPVPLVVSIGAAYVLAARPQAFYRLVCRLYGRPPV